MENTNENKLFDFLDVNLVARMLKKIRKYASKNFAKFSAITAVCFSIVLWIIRSLGYFYTLGRFSVYHIDKSYIDVWSEGFFAQVIQSVSVVILFLTVNYIYFQLSIPQNNKNAKRRILKVGFVLLEVFGLSVWINLTNGISLNDLLKDLRNASMRDISTLMIVWCGLLAIVNCLGMYANLFHRFPIKEKKTVSEDRTVVKPPLDKMGETKTRYENDKEKRGGKHDDLKYKEVIGRMVVPLIICIIAFAFMYTLGIQMERQRSEFKYVKEKTEILDGEEYINTDQTTGDSYYLYPIVYENEQVYILSRIRKDMTIDCSFLKVIDKENVNTYYIDNLKLNRDF